MPRPVRADALSVIVASGLDADSVPGEIPDANLLIVPRAKQDTSFPRPDSRLLLTANAAHLTRAMPAGLHGEPQAFGHHAQRFIDRLGKRWGFRRYSNDGKAAHEPPSSPALLPLRRLKRGGKRDMPPMLAGAGIEGAGGSHDAPRCPGVRIRRR